MKKVVSLIVTIIITLLLVLTSYAVNVNTYQIDELGMSIDVPAEYIVFTRSVESDDPNLETYGLTQNDVLNAMEKGNIYLSILDKDNNFEIAITMTENGLEDLNQFDDTSIDTMVSLLKEEYEKLGVIVDGYDVYQHSQAKFIKIYQTNKEGTICGLQYYTIYANKAINITLKSYSDKINSSEESTMKEIIDSVHFGMEFTLTGKTVEREIETTESFVYKDDETGVEFTVPENWIETSLYKEGEYMDAKFQSNIEKTIIILYGSTNLWENLSEAEQSAISRVDIDNSFFTVSDVAELMEVSQSMVSKENYGGKDYFIIERTQTTSMLWDGYFGQYDRNNEI